jgi:hypothetical protein
MGGHGAGKIDPMHEPSTQQGSQRVGVVGQNNLGHLGLRVSDRAWGWGFVSHRRFAFVVLLSSCILVTLAASCFLLQIGIEKAFRHFLHPWIVVAAQPLCLREIELQLSMVDRKVIFFAHKVETEDSNREVVCSWIGLLRVRRSSHGKAHGIADAIERRPTAIGWRIRGCRNASSTSFATEARLRGRERCSEPHHPAAQRKARGMRPVNRSRVLPPA